MRQTIYSDKIQSKKDGLAAMRNAFAFIERLPEMADPDKLTPEVKADLAERTARLKEFYDQTEQELTGLETAHQEAINAGFYVENPPLPDFEPGGRSISTGQPADPKRLIDQEDYKGEI